MSPGISGLLARRVHWCHVLWPACRGSGGSFGSGAEGSSPLSAQDNSFFPVRSEYLLISTPQPPIWVPHPKQISSYSSLPGPVLHPAAALLLFPVLFALWRAGCQAQQKSRAGPGPEMQEGWKKDGREFIAFSFLYLCLQASILTTPLSTGPWSSPALKSPVSTIELP